MALSSLSCNSLHKTSHVAGPQKRQWLCGPAGETSRDKVRACSRSSQTSTRRSVLVLAPMTVVLMGKAEGAYPDEEAVAPSQTEICARQKLDGELAAIFLKAVYTTVLRLQVMEEKAFQLENFRFRDREYKYYYEAHKDELPAIPDLSDLTGGLSNKVYFNFVNYSLWKTVSRHVSGRDARAKFCQTVGTSLLLEIWPEGIEQARALASKREDGRATQAEVVQLLRGMYDKLKDGGFLCAYMISWGDLPGGWRADWMQNGVLEIDGIAPPSPVEDALASIFQIKVQQPADIGGSVALRSEEDGFWSRALPTMSSALLAEAGYPDVLIDDYFYQDEWAGPTSLLDQFLLLIGDPLEMVEIPFTPSTLVQNFIVADN